MATRRRRRLVHRKLRRWFRKQDRLTRVLFFAVVILGLLVARLLLTSPREERRPQAKEIQRTPRAAFRRPAGATARPERPRPAAGRPAGTSALGPASRPCAALVIDDLGQNLEPLAQLAELGIPLSVAVLPLLDQTPQTVRAAARLKFEILLHLPMEPLDTQEKHPGPGALLTTMSSEEIRGLLRKDLAAVPGAVGVNNHMGSRFTTDPQALGLLMSALKEYDLFWLDSRTTPLSLAYSVAREQGLPAADRDVFLDAQDDPVLIRSQVLKLIEIAKRTGAAVGIGHPHPGTLTVLLAMREELRSCGVQWVPVSSLVRSTDPPEKSPWPPAISSGRGLAAAASPEHPSPAP